MGIMDFTPIALKNLFSKPATKNYPAQPIDFPERSRGHVEIDKDQCILCGMCQRRCPSSAITVDRASKTWSIERMGCVQCSNCVENCPKKCLSIVPGYTEPSTTKTVDTVEIPFSAPAPKKPAAGSDAKEELTSGKITNNVDTCVFCGLCAKACPVSAISVDRAEGTWTINRDECIQCGACIGACKAFNCLSYAEDDGEKGNVTFKKSAEAMAKKKAPAKKAEKTEDKSSKKKKRYVVVIPPDAPDASLLNGRITNNIDNCTLCTLCQRKCPVEAITVDRDNQTWTINRDDCIQCGQCVEGCNFEALGFMLDNGFYGSQTYTKD